MIRLLTAGFAFGFLLGTAGCDSENSSGRRTGNSEGGTPVNAGSQPLHLLGLAGQAVDPFQTNSAALVFLFVSTDCPISNRYAPEIRRLHAQFHTNRVAFWLVYPDPDTTGEAIRKHLADYQYSLPVLRDPQHHLVKLARVRVTPEAAVFGSGRKLIYHGRIDDQYVAFGKERPAPTRHDLQDVLDAVSSGKSPVNSSAPAIGCYISDLR
jgi:hypothetical protein